MRLILLMLLVVACPMLGAQNADEQARRITSKPEYKGYRVERPPGTTAGESTDRSTDGGSDGDGGTDGDGGSDSDGDGGARRGTGPGRTGRGGGGGSGGGGSGMSAPMWLGGLIEVLAWVILAVGVVVALFFIAKALLGINWKRKPKSAKSKRKKVSKPGEVETAAPVEEPEELDPSVFDDALAAAMREYKAALARDDYAAATLLAYRIFWLRAGWQGCVEKADVRTWRDALRMVRASETRQDVRALLPMVERVRYAEYRPAKGEFNTWSLNLEKIEPQGVLQ